MLPVNNLKKNFKKCFKCCVDLINLNNFLFFCTADSSVVKGVNGGMTFIEGDLIWGQIRGFPSWPGKVVPPCEVIDPEPLEMGKVNLGFRGLC